MNNNGCRLASQPMVVGTKEQAGYPDVVKRVLTPEGGIEGSQGRCCCDRLKTGIPGKISNEMHQDDFIANVQYRTGGPIPVAKCPSATTRVYLPPIEEWENRNGPHFAFRAAVETTIMEKGKFFLAPSKEKEEIYWPGLFILRESKTRERPSRRQALFPRSIRSKRR